MRKPNVIFIVLDTMRSKNMSCYGYTRETTPYIDRFCSENLFYKNAFSPAIWTVPSHASMFTGTYPSVHGALNLHRKLDTRLITLAEVLSKNGYDTISFSNNNFISIADFGLSRGFDHSEGQPYPKNKAHRILSRGSQYARGTLDCGAEITNNYAKKMVSKKGKSDKPFFLFLNYMEVHAPYTHLPRKTFKRFVDKRSRKAFKTTNQDTQKYLTRSITMGEDDFRLLRACYDAQTAYLDSKIGELLNSLDNKGFLDNTMVIITSDHGDLIGEHDLMHHSYAIYDELIKVPLTVKLPGKTNGGTSIESPVSLINIPATIIELLGLDAKAFAEQLQAPMLPLNSDGGSDGFIFSECERPKNEFKETYPDFDFSVYDKQYLAVRSKEYKYVWASDDNHLLYRVVADTDELTNIITDEPTVTEKMENIRQSWYDSLDKATYQTEEAVELDPEVKEKLKALGYF